jgi:ABC-type molybdate transport system permease subunit
VTFETFVYFSSGFVAGLVLGFTMTIVAFGAALVIARRCGAKA